LKGVGSFRKRMGSCGSARVAGSVADSAALQQARKQLPSPRQELPLVIGIFSEQCSHCEMLRFKSTAPSALIATPRVTLRPYAIARVAPLPVPFGATRRRHNAPGLPIAPTRKLVLPARQILAGASIDADHFAFANK
jgi:hypothetical protein